MLAYSVKPDHPKYKELFKWFRKLLNNKNVDREKHSENFVADVWDSLSKE